MSGNFYWTSYITSSMLDDQPKNGAKLQLHWDWNNQSGIGCWCNLLYRTNFNFQMDNAFHWALADPLWDSSTQGGTQCLWSSYQIPMARLWWWPQSSSKTSFRYQRNLYNLMSWGIFITANILVWCWCKGAHIGVSEAWSIMFALTLLGFDRSYICLPSAVWSFDKADDYFQTLSFFITRYKIRKDKTEHRQVFSWIFGPSLWLICRTSAKDIQTRIQR